MYPGVKRVLHTHLQSASLLPPSSFPHRRIMRTDVRVHTRTHTRRHPAGDAPTFLFRVDSFMIGFCYRPGRILRGSAKNGVGAGACNARCNWHRAHEAGTGISHLHFDGYGNVVTRNETIFALSSLAEYMSGLC